MFAISNMKLFSRANFAPGLGPIGTSAFRAVGAVIVFVATGELRHIPRSLKQLAMQRKPQYTKIRRTSNTASTCTLGYFLEEMGSILGPLVAIPC